MAAPRIFVSSTLSDLKHVRAALCDFIRQLGFDPVLFEEGAIPYPSDQRLEDACRVEVAKSDIVVSIIASRSGTLARRAQEENRWASISRIEVEHAVEMNIQLFCFVESQVMHEYELWSTNLDNAEFLQSVHWCSVDRTNVFEFIHYIKSLERNKAIFTYDGYQNIVTLLRTQIAGLLQDLLRQRAKQQLSSDVNKLVQAISAAENVTRYLEKQSAANKAGVEDILMTRHPIFQRLQALIGTDVRLFFETLRELDALLQLHGYQRIDDKQIPDEVSAKYRYWTRIVSGQPREFIGVPYALLVVDENATSGGYRLGSIDLVKWRDEFIVLESPLKVQSLEQFAVSAPSTGAYPTPSSPPRHP